MDLIARLESVASRKYNLKTISGRLAYVRRMAKHMRRIPDSPERDWYVQHMAIQVGLRVDTIQTRAISAGRRSEHGGLC